MRTTAFMRAWLIAPFLESFKLPRQTRISNLRLFSPDFEAFTRIGLNFSGIVTRGNARGCLGVVGEPCFY
jgi:hypothetical protein